jgi:hypothetical protein
MEIVAIHQLAASRELIARTIRTTRRHRLQQRPLVAPTWISRVRQQGAREYTALHPAQFRGDFREGPPGMDSTGWVGCSTSFAPCLGAAF